MALGGTQITLAVRVRIALDLVVALIRGFLFFPELELDFVIAGIGVSWYTASERISSGMPLGNAVQGEVDFK